MADNMKIVNFLESGLKAESLRQQAIAQNVANLQTPGYRRLDVKFEDIFNKALDKTNPDAVDIEDIQPETFTPGNTPVNAQGNDVNLDTEIGNMVENTLRHRTYMLLLKKKYRQIETAMKTNG